MCQKSRQTWVSGHRKNDTFERPEKNNQTTKQPRNKTILPKTCLLMLQYHSFPTKVGFTESIDYDADWQRGTSILEKVYHVGHTSEPIMPHLKNLSIPCTIISYLNYRRLYINLSISTIHPPISTKEGYLSSTTQDYLSGTT